VWLCQLWSSGFGISLSLAGGSLNGDKINATMYCVLSQTPSSISELDRPQADKLKLEKLLYFPDRCYDGHHTLLVSHLFFFYIFMTNHGVSLLTRHIL
jgi:hypothetical protein